MIYACIGNELLQIIPELDVFTIQILYVQKIKNLKWVVICRVYAINIEKIKCGASDCSNGLV